MSETQTMTSAPTTPTRRRSRSRSKGRAGSELKPIRVWCAGAFDTLHFAHINFLRKVKEKMTLRFPKVEVVVGLYSDQELIAAGQRPVFSLDERAKMLRANRWVDEVVKNAPVELSKKVLKDHNCDYAFRSELDDSPKFGESGNAGDELLECGLLIILTVPPHEYAGITTSDIVNRMMLLEKRDENNNTASGRDWAPKKLTFPDSLSCKEMLKFASGNIPKAEDKIVYVDGSFDVLNPGHVHLLKQARELGDFLYVGLHSDETISKDEYAGSSFPVLQWNERLIALLSCKYVSEVVLDAPFIIDDSLLDAFKVAFVVPSKDDYSTANDGINSQERYKAAKQRQIFRELPIEDSATDPSANLTTIDILNRVHQNWTDYSYITDKSLSDVENGFNELNLLQNRDAGDVLKFSESDTNSTH